jgi:hypothetical protein
MWLTSGSQIQAHACIGGKSVGDDIRKLDYGQHIVSGTPGRVFDMIRRRNLRTRNIKTLILDEADEMLNQVDISLNSLSSSVPNSLAFSDPYFICIYIILAVCPSLSFRSVSWSPPLALRCLRSSPTLPVSIHRRGAAGGRASGPNSEGEKEVLSPLTSR